MNSPDQIATLFSVTLMVVAFGAVLYAFWKRKKRRWWVLACLIATVFITPSASVAAILMAILGKIDESKMNRRGWTQFTYKGHLVEISDYDALRKSRFEFKVKIDGQDRSSAVMTWPADPDPDDVIFGADAGPVKRAKLFIDWAHGGKGP